jgi:molybdopterin converting factor small subunit
MDVTVKLHGPLRYGAGGARREPIALVLPEGATAGDLVDRLSERIGERLDAAAGASRALPSSLRLFVGGELVASRDRPLASRDGACGQVVVVVTTPISGG